MKSPDAEHTELPWAVGPERSKNVHGAFRGTLIVGPGDGKRPELHIALVAQHPGVNIPTARANAAFIVRAINAHADMLAALKEAVAQTEAQMVAEGQTKEYAASCATICAADEAMTAFSLARARKAIALAETGEGGRG